MAATGAARGQRAAMKRTIAKVMRRTRVARALFLDEQGQVTGDGAKLIADLAREAGMNRRGYVPDADMRLFRDGGQHIVRYLIDLLALDTRQIDNLSKQLEEIDNGR